MNIFADILNAKTREDLEVFSSVPDILLQILAKSYSYTSTIKLIEFINSQQYNDYVVPLPSTSQVSPVKSTTISQEKKIIEYQIVDSIMFRNKSISECNYINSETGTITNTTDKILSYNYTASLFPYASDYISTTKLIYRGVVNQITSITYSVNNQNDFYLLDKLAVTNRPKFTYIPKAKDPFYAQKMILLEIYQAPTIDSTASFRVSILNSANVLILFAVIFNTIAVIIVNSIKSAKNKIYFMKVSSAKNENLEPSRHSNIFYLILIVAFIIIGILAIVISIIVMLGVGGYSYKNFTSADEYNNSMNMFANIINISFFVWIGLMIVLGIVSYI